VLLAGCSKVSSLGKRNRALITVMYRGGLKVGEALALMPADVNASAGVLNVHRARSARVVAIDPTAMRIVETWLEQRAANGIMEGPLFCAIGRTSAGRPINPAYVRTLLPRLAKEAGITKRVHPEAFRNTLAVELLREDVPLGAIQAQLGISGLDAAVRFLAQLDEPSVDPMEIMRSRPWDVLESEPPG
jgi:site-specific recombinase XerD